MVLSQLSPSLLITGCVAPGYVVSLEGPVSHKSHSSKLQTVAAEAHLPIIIRTIRTSPAATLVLRSWVNVYKVLPEVVRAQVSASGILSR